MQNKSSRSLKALATLGVMHASASLLLACGSDGTSEPCDDPLACTESGGSAGANLGAPVGGGQAAGGSVEDGDNTSNAAGNAGVAGNSDVGNDTNTAAGAGTTNTGSVDDAINPQAGQGGADTDDADDGSVDDDSVDDGSADETGCTGTDIFDDSQLHTFSITIAEDELSWLENNGDLEEYVPGDLMFNDEAIGQVGIRYKGSDSSLGRCWGGGRRSGFGDCDKVSMKLKFHEYEDGTRLCGLKRINLHSMRGDPSKLHERLGYGLFRQMGVHTSRVTHAKLIINGESRGLFALVEQLDGRFTKDRWQEAGNGNLFKELWPGNDDPEVKWPERVIEHLKTNKEEPDVAEMTALNETIKASSVDSFLADVSPYFDIEQFVRYMAVDRAISNVDGVTRYYDEDRTSPQFTADNHNFYIYQPGAGAKFLLVPWDLDLTFEYPDPFLNDVGLPNWNFFPSDCTRNVSIWGYAKPPACDRLMGYAVQAIWDDFVTVGNEFLSGPFNAELMLADLERWAAQIAPHVEDDRTIDGESWREQVDTLREAIPDLVEAYRDHLTEGLIFE